MHIQPIYFKAIIAQLLGNSYLHTVVVAHILIILYKIFLSLNFHLPGANVAKVKFMVRHAGQYRITVMVGGQHVAGSPFLRDFTAGPADAQRTVVLRHCSTVVCTASVAHVLYVEPRDEYSNVCTYRSGEDPLEVSEL